MANVVLCDVCDNKARFRIQVTDLEARCSGTYDSCTAHTHTAADMALSKTAQLLEQKKRAEREGCVDRPP